MEKIITQENLDKLIEKLSVEYDIFAPVGDEKYSEFRPVKKLEEANLSLLNTTKPLKELFLPSSEKLFSVQGKNESLALESQSPVKKKRIILGAKSCDMRGIELLSKVYAGGDCPDELFLERKSNTIIVGLSCFNPCDTCFCTAVGVNPVVEQGMDIVITKINGRFLADFITDSGKAIFEKYSDIFSKLTSENMEKKKELIDSISTSHNLCLHLERIKSFLDKSFNHPLWEEISTRCINCGICAYLCPVCQCFDIHDETDNQGNIVRFRTWDNCMSPDFTRMAGGHNPRAKKGSRFRQRFLHKFKYYMELFSTIGCTGCGRCIRFCPVNIDILELLKQPLYIFDVVRTEKSKVN